MSKTSEEMKRALADPKYRNHDCIDLAHTLCDEIEALEKENGDLHARLLERIQADKIRKILGASTRQSAAAPPAPADAPSTAGD